MSINWLEMVSKKVDGNNICIIPECLMTIASQFMDIYIFLPSVIRYHTCVFCVWRVMHVIALWVRWPTFRGHHI